MIFASRTKLSLSHQACEAITKTKIIHNFVISARLSRVIIVRTDLQESFNINMR
jgi:hypothetical protein